MSANILQTEYLDDIVKKTISALESGKKQIYGIAEEARNEWDELQNRLAELKTSVSEAIDESEDLYKREKENRLKLMMVSKNFKVYNEADIKKAYDATRDLQVKLAISKDKEIQLIAQRSEVEQRVRKLRNTLDRAEYLVSHVAVAMNYLLTSLANISDTLEEMQKKEQQGIQIILAQEEEHKRLARDIHDGPAQSLSNIIIKCEICEKLIEKDVEKAIKEIRELKGLVRESLKELRDIIFDLRPMSLDDLGLLPTLQSYVSKFNSDFGINVTFEHNLNGTHIDSTVEVAIFRIIQEALTNIKKHAKVKSANIKLLIIGETLKISIKDKGVGFVYDRRLTKEIYSNGSSGYGIYGMRQRAEILKGKLVINSKQGEGTEIIFEIPVKSLKLKDDADEKDKSYSSR